MFLSENPRISDSELKVDNDENDTKPKNSKVKTSLSPALSPAKGGLVHEYLMFSYP